MLTEITTLTAAVLCDYVHKHSDIRDKGCTGSLLLCST